MDAEEVVHEGEDSQQQQQQSRLQQEEEEEERSPGGRQQQATSVRQPATQQNSVEPVPLRLNTSPQMMSDNSFSQWKRNMRRWLRGTILYIRCRPLLVICFVFFSAAHVLLSVIFLRLFPCPLLLTWAQLSQSAFYAFILGEAGDAFAAFRSLFPSTSRTLRRAYAAVAAHTTKLNRRRSGGWHSSSAASIHGRSSSRSADGYSSSSVDRETEGHFFWKHTSGLLLQLLLRLLPYSLGYCLLQYAHNVLAAHVRHPLQLPIVSSLAVAAQELVYCLCGEVSRSSSSKAAAAAASGSRRFNSSSLGASTGRGGAAGSPAGGRLATAAAATEQEEIETNRGAAAGETELTPAGSAERRRKRRTYEEEGLLYAYSLHSEASGVDTTSSISRCPLYACLPKCCVLPVPRVTQLLSLLLLGGGPALYIYWQSASCLFAAAAVLFVFASLIYRMWLLPKALHLPRCSSSNNIVTKGATAAARAPPAQQQLAAVPNIPQTARENHEESSAASGEHSHLPFSSSPSLGRVTLSSSSFSAAAAASTSCFRPKEISLLQNLTGALLLLVPGLLSGEQQYTTFPFRFLLSNRWDDWLAAGCWICIGTVSFLRRTTSSSIMREAGAHIWKAAELVALICVGCCSWLFFGNPDPASVVCCFFLVAGRLLGLAAAPFTPHHRHHHHADILLQEKQQQQLYVLPSSSPAAIAVTSGMPRDAASLSHSYSSFRDRPSSRRLNGSNPTESIQQEAVPDEERRTGSSSGNVFATAIGSGDYASQRSSGPLLRQDETSVSHTYNSRDDMPSFNFPSSGGRSFALWSAEAASRAAAAAELPGVRLLEEPDIFLRPPHRWYPFGRRFSRFSASASLGEYASASSRRDIAAGVPWSRAGAAQALLAEDRSSSRGRTTAATEAVSDTRKRLFAIGEEEEGEEGGIRAPSGGEAGAAAGGEAGAAAGGEAGGSDDEEEEIDALEAAAAAKRGFLMEIVRAYVSRTTYEDLLLLEEWGGTAGVAAAVGADLLQGLPDEERRAGGVSSSSSENEEESTTEDEDTEEEDLSAAQPGYLSQSSHDAAAAAPAAARGWPATTPLPTQRRRSQHRSGRQKQQLSHAAIGKEAAAAGGRVEKKELIPAVLAPATAKATAVGGKEEVVVEQRRLYGVNRLPRRPLSSFLSLCLEAASDATLKVLMFCGLMSLVLALLFSKEPETEVIEGLAIWVAVLVVVLVTAGNDWMKEQQFALLSAVKEDKKCAVIRDGEAKQLSVFDVVVGDLLQLEAGDEIPADALLVQGRDVKVDESSLTGESDPIAKESFLDCMRDVTHLQRQQQQQQQQQQEGSPFMMAVKNSSPQQQQTHPHEEERESIAVSTAAESVPTHNASTHQQQQDEHSLSVAGSPSPLPGSPLLPPSRSPYPSTSAIETPEAAAAAGSSVSLTPSRVPAAKTGVLSPGSSPLSFPFAAAGEMQSAAASGRCLMARHHLVPSPVLLSGTTLSTGSCTAMVVAVGSYSQVGQTFQKLAFDPEPTPLQMKLNALAEDIGNFGLAAAVAAFIVLLFEFWLLYWLHPQSEARQTMRAVDILHEHVEFFVTAITILVVAVPEGLPLAVTISLAYSISQMLRDQNYVRRLAACEIMGGANEICSDKTGTLTKNQMTVTVFWQGSPPRRQQQLLSSASSSSVLLLNVPATATTTAAQDKQIQVGGDTGAMPSSLAIAATARLPAGSAAATGTAPATTTMGFSKDYTQPLLEAELSTTARSTEAETAAAATARGLFSTENSSRDAVDDVRRNKYAAWLEGEEQRRNDRKWLLLAEAIAANSTAFLQREEEGEEEEEGGDDEQELVTVAAAGDTELERGVSTEQLAAAGTAAGAAENTRAQISTRYKHVGSPTECALLAFSMFSCHENYAFLRKQLLGEEERNLVERREFTSDRKMMTTIIKLSPEAIELEKGLHKQQPSTAEHQTEALQQQQQQQGVVGQEPRVGGYRVFVKGAAERVLHQCSRVLVRDGEEYALTPSLISNIEEQVINTMAARALRTICIAYKDLPADSFPGDGKAPGNTSMDASSSSSIPPAAVQETPTTMTTASPTYNNKDAAASAAFASAAGAAEGRLFDAFERDLICLGIAGIEDPVREEVPEAVLQCQSAGIRVRMVTGDNLLTATTIAAQCNIYHEAAGGLALLGSDFIRCIGGVVCQRCGTAVCDCATDSKTAEEEGRPLRTDVIKNIEAFQGIWKRLEVLARSQPTDKYALVCALQQMHRVVAVTGDGTNDAPALRKADVGFAMGLSGKEVAKQAADIVMLDDNFTCIVKAVRWGRSVYDNIRRFLQFQLTVNVVAVLLTVICVAIEREAPLSAVQMLWINLIMDSFASLALATEPPTDALLKRKPHGRDSYLVSRIMLTSILVAACYQVTVMLLLIFYGERFLPETPWKFVAPQERIKYKFCEFSDGVPEQCVGRHMVSGRRYKLFSTEEDYKTEWLREFGPSRHSTFIFNTFVFMQVFNMINARDVDDESPSSSLVQLFVAMLRNKLGLGVWLFVLLAQILMTELGGRVLGCHFDGLTPEQWGLSLLLAAIGLLWGRLPHAFPSLSKLAPELGRREELIEDTHSLALELRGRTPNRINERLGLASYTFAKKYAKKARLMTLSRMQKRRQQQLHRQSGSPSSPNSMRGIRSNASSLRFVGSSSGSSSSGSSSSSSSSKRFMSH